MKIYITGSTGSGKTTVARQLSLRLSAPAYEMDEIVWDNSEGYSGKRYPDELRDRKISEMLQKQSWIAEGIYFTEWMLPILYETRFVLILTPPIFVRDSRLIRRSVLSNFQVGQKKEDLVLLYKNLKWGHAFERGVMPKLIDLLEREKIKYHVYSKGDAARFVCEELV